MKIPRALLFIFLFATTLNAQTYELRKGDTLLLVRENFSWRELEPVLREYDNLKDKKRQAVSYRWGKPRGKDTLRFKAEEAGTYYFANAPAKTKDAPFFLDAPPHLGKNLNAVQIVVREDDSYLGYLTELLRTPFIIPPMRIPEGHQTDLRVGTDCAELAIYGKRREGFDVPYCGPKGIYEFLDTLQGKPEAGCILHFGAQVSVLYEDRGVPGAIDDDDLIIEAYGSGTKIVAFSKCAFYGRPYRLFIWKSELPVKK